MFKKKINSSHYSLRAPNNYSASFLLVFLLSIFTLSAAGNPMNRHYPSIGESQGEFLLNGKSNKIQKLNSSVQIADKALFETASDGSVEIHLDAQRSFNILPNSEVFLPAVGSGNGEVPVLILKKGRLRWKQLTEAAPLYNVALHSEFFEFILPKGDFVFEMNPEIAFAGVKVIKGEIVFSVINGEGAETVREGQQVGFQGVLEKNEIVYDVLLRGKKIPRGQLTHVTAMDEEKNATFADSQGSGAEWNTNSVTVTSKSSKEKKLKHSAIEPKSSIPEKQKKIPKPQKGPDEISTQKSQETQNPSNSKSNICDSPIGAFNECSWVCINNPKNEKKFCLISRSNVKCIRRRCDGNGRWVDEMSVDKVKSTTQCKAKPIVAPCDY